MKIGGGELMRIHAILALPPAEKKHTNHHNLVHIPPYHALALEHVHESFVCSRMPHKRHVLPENCADKDINNAIDTAVNTSEGVVNALSSTFGVLESARSHRER